MNTASKIYPFQPTEAVSTIQTWDSRKRYLALMTEIRKMTKMHRLMVESRQDVNAEMLAVMISKKKQELYMNLMGVKDAA